MDLFCYFDMDGSGQIDKDEFVHAAQCLGMRIDRKQAMRIFEEACTGEASLCAACSVDVDCSDSIDFEEFLALMDDIDSVGTQPEARSSRPGRPSQVAGRRERPTC